MQSMSLYVHVIKRCREIIEVAQFDSHKRPYNLTNSLLQWDIYRYLLGVDCKAELLLQSTQFDDIK